MKKNNFIVTIGIILTGYLIYPTIIFETDFFARVINLQAFDTDYELLKIVNRIEVYNTVYIYALTIIIYYILINISEKYKEQSNLLYEDIFYLSVYAIFLYYLLNDWYDYYIMYMKPEFKFNRQYIYEYFVFQRKLTYIWLLIPALINNSVKYYRINIVFIVAIILNGIITLSRFEVFAMLVLLFCFTELQRGTKTLIFASVLFIILLRVISMDHNSAYEQIAWEPISYRISYLYERLSDPIYIDSYGADILPVRSLSRAGLVDILGSFNKVIGLTLLICIGAYFFRFVNFIFPSVIATSFFKAYRGGLIDALNYCLKYAAYLLIIFCIYKIYMRMKIYLCTT